MRLTELLALSVLDVVRLPRRHDRHKVLRKTGRMLLPKMHVADVDWPAKLVAMHRLAPGDELDPDAVTAATIVFLEGIEVVDVYPDETRRCHATPFRFLAK